MNTKIKSINNKKLIMGIGIVSILTIFVVVAAINQKNPSDSKGMPKSGIPVNIEEARIDTLISKVSATGIVEAKESETVYVSNTLKIEDILVETGDTVKKDEALVNYDPSFKKELEQQLKEAEIALQNADLRLQSMTTADQIEILNAESSLSQAQKMFRDTQTFLNQIELSVEQLKLKVKDAEKNLENNKILFNEGAIAKRDLDESNRQLTELKNQLSTEEMKIQSAKLDIENAEKQKSIAQHNLSTTYNKFSDPKQEAEIKIQKNQVESQKMRVDTLKEKLEEQLLSSKASMNGTVVEIFAEKGAWINQNSPLLKISNLDNLIIKVNMSEYDAPSIEKGQRVTFKGDAIKNALVEGRVSHVAPTATIQNMGNSQEAMVEVTIEVLNKDSTLKPGYTVDVEIITAEHEDTVVIPLLGVVDEKDGTKIAYIMKDDYTVERRVVKTGIYSDLYVEVTGVNEGEKIITNYNPNIKEGAKVKPLETKTQLGDGHDKN
ncbi:MAG: efflux RND transporter periplasmic adaptor subunit [Epulopiscium sp.]|nr:efflux RND transporter periplasmic adaptor subunit [Candidatus Epulonipiscium sp.]